MITFSSEVLTSNSVVNSHKLPGLLETMKTKEMISQWKVCIPHSIYISSCIYIYIYISFSIIYTLISLFISHSFPSLSLSPSLSSSSLLTISIYLSICISIYYYIYLSIFLLHSHSLLFPFLTYPSIHLSISLYIYSLSIQVNPKRPVIPSAELEAASDLLNQNEKLNVRNLHISTRKEFEHLKEGENQKRKTYVAVVCTDKPQTPETLVCFLPSLYITLHNST